MLAKINARFLMLIVGFLMTYLFIHEVWWEIKNLNLIVFELKKEIECLKSAKTVESRELIAVATENNELNSL